MEPLLILFGASTVTLVIMFFLLCFFVVAALENDSPVWATFTVTSIAAFMWFFTDFSYRYDVRANTTWQGVVIFSLAYICIGTLWSIFKWQMELSERREKFDELVKEYREKYSVEKQIPVTFKNDKRFCQYVKSEHESSCFVVKQGYSKDNWSVKARPKPNKSRITGWMVYWPWSLLWSILDDFITGIFRWLYRQLVGTYEWMAERSFRGID